MSVRLELQCINLNDPSTDECFSLLEKGLGAVADDSQADVARQYKLLQKQAPAQGWRWAKLAQGSRGWLCPNCVALYESQTGQTLN